MTLKAVIANFTEAYDLTKDKPPTTPVTPEPTRNNVKVEDISTSWVDKLSTSVARSTLHDRVLPGVSEDQMCASDVRSFALIMMEMMTWYRQMDLVARKRALEMDLREAQNGGRIDGAFMVDDVQICMDDSQEQSSPVPFVRHINNDPRKPRSRRERSLRREQQQHINVVCESLPEEEQEAYDCNTFPRRNSIKNKANGPHNKTSQTKSDLLRIIHQKQDSTCSSDSGVSSQPSSKAMSLHSGSSGCSDRSPRFQNHHTKGNHLGNVEFDATTEMWVDSHAEELNGFRPCLMEHGMQSTPNILSDTDADFIRDTTTSEEQTAHSLDNLDREDPAMLPRSSSSLSQFYVRKRSPRPHSFSVGRSTATLPNNGNKQEIDLITARDNVNATLRPKSCFNSSELLDDNIRQQSLTPTPSLPLQRHPGSALPYLPGLIIPPRRSETPPPEKQFATIRRTRSRKRSSTTIPFSLNQQQQMNIITNPKHRTGSYPNQISYPYNVQLNSDTISLSREDTPMLNRLSQFDSSCPSGIGEQHLGYCQELQSLFPHQLCSDGSAVQQGVECGRAMSKWMVPLRKMDGYLPKQVRCCGCWLSW